MWATILRSLGQGDQFHAPLRCIDPDRKTGTSKAVIVDEGVSLLHTAQILPSDERGQVVTGGLSNQTRRVLARLDGLLVSAHSDLQIAVKLTLYISTSNVLPIVVQALVRKFSHATKPAVSFVVTPLPEPTARVAMDAVAPTLFLSKASKGRMDISAGLTVDSTGGRAASPSL